MTTTTDDDNTRGNDQHHFFNLWVDSIVTVLSVIVFLLALFIITVNTELRGDDKLLKVIKIQYATMQHANPITDCKYGYQSSTLLSDMTGDKAVKKTLSNRFSWQNGAEDSWLKSDNIVDPFDLKVYKWTRKWDIVTPVGAGTSKLDGLDNWFCTNAYEINYGACQNFVSVHQDIEDTIVSKIMYTKQGDNSTLQTCTGHSCQQTVRRRLLDINTLRLMHH